MKPMILVLLAAVSLQAQSLADIARRQRAMRTQNPAKPGHVYTTQDLRAADIVNPAAATTGTEGTAPAGSTPAATAPAATPAAGTPAKPATPPGPDAAKKYAEDVERLKTLVRDLQDQETAIQLQLNQATNQFLSPVTDTESRQVAQGRIVDSQSRLNDVRAQLKQARDQLTALEAQGPPKN